MNVPQTKLSTFASLKIRNYRLYFAGQLVSTCGSWMQGAAQLLYVQFRLGGGGKELGIVSACQFLPIMTLGAWAGSVVDRLDKKRLLTVVQAYMGVVAGIQAVLVVTGHARFWNICALAFALGVGSMFEMPCRQAFTTEMVGPEHLANAVGLNSTIFQTGRVLGPAFAGLVVKTIGYAWAFALNSLSFGAIVLSLIAIRRSELYAAASSKREPGAVRAGLAYARRSPTVRTVLLCVLIIGSLALNFNVFLPVMAKDALGGNEDAVVSMQSMMGLGSLVGALLAARRGTPTGMLIARTAGLLGVAFTLLALSPSLWVARIAVAIVGAAFISFMLACNATLQLSTEPKLRGRVMALYVVMFAGTTPVGSPTVGFIADHFGPRISVGVAAAASFVSAGLALRAIRRGWLRRGTPTTVTGDPLPAT